MSEKEENTFEKFNKNRRQFLVVGGASVASFFLGKIFGPSINLFSQDIPISERDFKDFRIVETNKEMKLYDRKGNELFIVDKESFRE
ncbi:MAG: hypothetical protein OQJ98_01120 [Candidatus Pacebacteria bacterium]|nr:hypothetical protein [Candidatus Paceibacterota bacterium]